MVLKLIGSMLLRLYSTCILTVDLYYISIYAAYEVFLVALHTIKPRSKKSVKDEIAVVVGASRGIGREVAFDLSCLGATVVCLDINAAGNESTVKQIRASGGKAFSYTCDVTQNEIVIKTVNSIEQNVGEISMLFHCCGVPSPRSYTSKPIPVKTTIDVSVFSHFWLLDAILPRMKKRRRGHIVMLTSVAGIRGLKHHMPLGVSQFAVQGLLESLLENLRLEKLHKNIFVSLVHIYPFVVSKELLKDPSMQVPNWFGTIEAKEATDRIMEGVLRNEIEISIPKHILHLGRVMKLLPRRVILLLREFLDTGVDFG